VSGARRAAESITSLAGGSEAYRAALWVDEHGYGEHGIQAATEIKTELEGLPPEADCEAAGARAKLLRKQFSNDIRKPMSITIDKRKMGDAGRYAGKSVNPRSQTRRTQVEGLWLPICGAISLSG
jgi:hypothetical protein